MRAILERLGFKAAFRYEKYRAEYTDGKGVATVDETPIGLYLELEGAPSWIDRTARALGFRRADYITASYYGLYREYCERRGEAVGDMVFEARAR
jgi:adenylate cyclase class 2